MTENPCPVCDRPIADTAYVCHGCTRHLVKALLRAAIEIAELDVTFARQDAVDVQSGSGTPSVANPYEGPRCEALCEHASCWRIRETGDQLDLWGLWCEGYCEHDACRRALDLWGRMVLREHRHVVGADILPNESAVPFHTGAAETLSIIGNTVGTWARHVSETRGTPIPVQVVPRRPDIEPVGDGARKGGDDAYCTCCDLPAEYCIRRPA